MGSSPLEFGGELSGEQAALIQITAGNEIVDSLVFGTVENGPILTGRMEYSGQRAIFSLPINSRFRTSAINLRPQDFRV